MKFVILLTSLLAMANCQTAVTNTYCPSGEYFGYVSTAYTQGLSPITGLDTTSSNYSPTGIYRVTVSNGADQCCYNCAKQTSGTCTTWTYDGCGNCYLSSATGSSNYLTTSCGGKSLCSGFASGFVTPTNTSSTTATTTTAASTTKTATCQVTLDQNSANTADTYTNAVSASDCCNKCAATSGCLGFAFLPISGSATGACWLKSYNPNTASNLVSYPDMVIGSVSG